jgi:hypothetical protein
MFVNAHVHVISSKVRPQVSFASHPLEALERDHLPRAPYGDAWCDYRAMTILFGPIVCFVEYGDSRDNRSGLLGELRRRSNHLAAANEHIELVVSCLACLEACLEAYQVN